MHIHQHGVSTCIFSYDVMFRPLTKCWSDYNFLTFSYIVTLPPSLPPLHTQTPHARKQTKKEGKNAYKRNWMSVYASMRVDCGIRWCSIRRHHSLGKMILIMKVSTIMRSVSRKATRLHVRKETQGNSELLDVQSNTCGGPHI